MVVVVVVVVVVAVAHTVAAVDLAVEAVSSVTSAEGSTILPEIVKRTASNVTIAVDSVISLVIAPPPQDPWTNPSKSATVVMNVATYQRIALMVL